MLMLGADAVLTETDDDIAVHLGRPRKNCRGRWGRNRYVPPWAQEGTSGFPDTPEKHHGNRTGGV